MKTGKLTRWADGTTLLLSVLVAASGIRLLTVAATRALDGTSVAGAASATEVPPRVAARKVPVRLRGAGAQDVAAPPRAERKQTAPARPAPPRRSARQPVTVAITAGPPRSEAYFKGRRLGSTPFFGDLDCAPGETVTITLVPPKGMPLEYARVCRPGATLTIAPGQPRSADKTGK